MPILGIREGAKNLVGRGNNDPYKEKKGIRESAKGLVGRGDSDPYKEKKGIRASAKGLIGRGESSNDRYKDHVSQPLERLTDPSSLPPPPQRRGTGLAPPPPPSSATSGGAKRKVVSAPSKYQDPRGGHVEPPPKFSRDEELEEYEHEQLQIEAPPDEPRAYRTDTTGLRTDHLPPPPGRRDGANVRSPPSYDASTTGAEGGRRAVPALPSRSGAAAAPSLPPRLPPRRDSGAASPASAASASPHTTGTSAAGSGGMLNQGAVSRLGAAGISVPGFGIGKSNSNNDGQQQDGGGHMNELQNRFARFNTSNSSQETTAAAAPAPAPAPSQGTTWAQKQAALKTASQFQKDPSKVSFSDAKAAASTANNFRQRHGEQVAAGAKTAQGWNQKYGVADKVGGFAQRFQGNQEQQQQQQAPPAEATPAAIAPAVAGKKKPPPPPPKKKPALAAAVAAPLDDDAPPPIPMSTRPTF